jgi:hypothetical protein
MTENVDAPLGLSCEHVIARGMRTLVGPEEAEAVEVTQSIDLVQGHAHDVCVFLEPLVVRFGGGLVLDQAKVLVGLRGAAKRLVVVAELKRLNENRLLRIVWPLRRSVLPAHSLRLFLGPAVRLAYLGRKRSAP